MNFLGFEREGDVAGVRNFVAVIASVICSTTPVSRIGADRPEVLSVVHQYGCGQMGDDLTQTRRTLVGLGANPNVAASLVVGLGCENNQASALAQSIPGRKPVHVISIQELGGSEETYRVGSDIVDELVRSTRTERKEMSLDRLTVGVLGVEPGERTFDAVYPVVGRVVDRLASLGVRVIIGVNQGLEPAGAAMAERAKTQEAEAAFRRMAEGMERRNWRLPEAGKSVVRPWTRDEIERSSREIAITGSAQFDAVVGYAERSSAKGVVAMTAPSDPAEAFSGLVASGATLIVAACGRGLFTGALGAPTLIVADLEVKASGLGETVDVFVSSDPDAECDRLVNAIVAVASGEETATERLGLDNFAISQVGTPF